jgi:UDP-arabinose 4-epimerase
LLNACAAFECINVIFSSSCATFGIPSQLPLTEGAAQYPVNPYGYTKLVVERMLCDAEAAHGTRHVALRYCNAAGADPEGEIGEMHDPETHLIPLALFAALGRQPSIKVFGSDYPRRMGPAFATTCTSATWPTRMLQHSSGWQPAAAAPRSI